MKLYRIRATDRDSGKRIFISGVISEETANKWKPTPSLKRDYKYFRKVKFNSK